MPMPLRSGSWIKTRGANSKRGRIYRLATSGRCPFDDEYVAAITEWGPNPMRFVNSVWWTVLLDAEYGVTYWPEEALEEGEEFTFRNLDTAVRYWTDLRPEPPAWTNEPAWQWTSSTTAPTASWTTDNCNCALCR